MLVHDGYVYFLAEMTDAHEYSAFKIGWAKDPHSRMQRLQTGNPLRLVLLAFVPGSKADEASLHGRFIAVRDERTEWFVGSSELIELLRQLGADIEVLGEEEKGAKRRAASIRREFAWLLERLDWDHQRQVELSRGALELLPVTDTE